MLIFNEAAWLNGETIISVAETNKGFQVQIHESAEKPKSYWYEVVSTSGIVYDSREDGNAYANKTDVEDSATEWFANYVSE